MDVFSTLNRKNKIAIAISSSILLAFALSLLVFGANSMGAENHLIQQAAEATRADMLYIHPEGH
ncbi:MAG: hypothetical protein ACI9QC_000923 [Oceanicoccus sp.]|jgi:hypothetical protein